MEINYEQATEYLKVMREMIRHENELVNNRLHWMFTLQGFLFGATSFIWKNSQSGVILLGLIGILSCASIGYTLARGLNAIHVLLVKTRDFCKGLPDDWQIPPVIGSRRKAIEWLLPSRMLPWVMGLAWIALLVACIFDIDPLLHLL